MNIATEKENLGAAYYEKFYHRACDVCVPVKLSVPIYVSPVVIEKEPQCLDKNPY